MRRSALVLIALALIGCETKYIPYHSTADIPIYSRLIVTDMTYLVGSKDLEPGRKYGVFSARDNTDKYYLLIVPKATGTTGIVAGSKYKDYALIYSVPLYPKQVQELLGEVQFAVQKWDTLCKKNDAVFVEYMVAPEQEIKKQSENVVNWNPSLCFVFQQIENKKIAELFLGQGVIKYTIELRIESDLTDFGDLLTLGMNDLKAKGYRETDE